MKKKKPQHKNNVYFRNSSNFDNIRSLEIEYEAKNTSKTLFCLLLSVENHSFRFRCANRARGMRESEKEIKRERRAGGGDWTAVFICVAYGVHKCSAKGIDRRWQMAKMLRYNRKWNESIVHRIHHAFPKIFKQRGREINSNRKLLQQSQRENERKKCGEKLLRFSLSLSLYLCFSVSH